MIRCSSLFCKLFQVKISSDILYEAFIKEYKSFKEECPYCHARGTLTKFATYERHVVDLLDGKPVYNSICVQRLVCSSCGHTHAILPDFLVPYRQYSLLFILRVLWLHFTGSKTVAALCRQAEITPSMLYRWKKLFLVHRSLWLSALERLASAVREFVCRLVELPRPCEFLHAFFRKTGFSFLQSHKNPANCQGPPA